MNVRKVVAGSVLAAGLGVAGLFGSATAFADVTDNPTTQDAQGFGVTNHMKNGFNTDNGVPKNGIGWIRSEQTGDQVSNQSGTNRVRIADPSTVEEQGAWGPINANNPTRVGNGR